MNEDPAIASLSDVAIFSHIHKKNSFLEYLCIGKVGFF